MLIVYLFIVTCAPLTLINGDVSYSTSAVYGRYPVGTTASFTCDNIYIRNGLDSSTCNITGEWMDELPTCIGDKLNMLLCFLMYSPLHSRDISFFSSDLSSFDTSKW